MAENTIENNELIGETDWSAATENFPYYPVAQFKLLAHYNKSKDELFDNQTLITALFFNNHKWLHHQLQNDIKIEITNDNQIIINISDENLDDKTETVNNVKAADISSTIKSSKEIINQTNTQQNSNGNQEEIAFEPLYTVDYFASQGIKVTEEMIANDKLGTQLKSFTEWLKSMKKIHTKQEGASDEQTDKIIQHIAETSNNNSNVVTEAMAEVLLKQNKMAAAIEMYEKLSLQYPHKSSYFAARINSLKSV